MTYRTILVHLNDERRLTGLLEVAVPIALANKAKLIGLAVLPPIIIVPDMDASPGSVIEEHRVAYAAQMSRMRAAFDETVRRSGVDAAWEAIDGQTENPFGDVAMIVISRARAADLVIVGQTNPDWALSGMLDVGEQVATESGRPVLLVPKARTMSGAAKRILVAWNGSREAARAVFDAVPVLVAADRVMVAWLDPLPADSDKATCTDICSALARHGVKCEMLRTERSTTGTGSTLLSLAGATRADLLVMGCYGHSRLREMVFGGATRYVLDHMAVPVLMAH